MKLLFMIPKLSYSGAPKMMAWVSNKMCELGYEVEFVTIYDSETQQPLNANISYVQLGIRQSKNWIYRNTLGMLKSIFKFRKEVRKYKPDIIVSFLDSVSYVYIFFNGIFWKDKILISERVDPYSRHGFKSKICFKIMSMSSHVVFQTTMARDFFGTRYLDKSDVIPNPVVLNYNISTTIKDNLKPPYKIAAVGRLSLTQKRQDIMIKTIQELKSRGIDCVLYIYGDGQDRTKIINLINSSNLGDSIVLMGQQSRILERICDSTCFILTSDYEGIPNSLIEAMSIGLPCISTDCSPGGAKILINNGINGYLVRKEDYVEIANIIELLIKDFHKRKFISENARKIKEDFSESKIAKMWDDVFKKMNG